MSTRSAIIIENKDGTAEGIYCHYDGYPEHHKPILLEHYQDEARVRELIALGDISALEKNIGSKHDFNSPPEDECNVYGRDRGEGGCEPKAGENVTEVADQIGHNGHVYVFRCSCNEWWYEGYSSGDKFVKLENVTLE